MLKTTDKHWTAPRFWDGDTCYILGGGPSVNQIDLSRLQDKHVIAVNMSYQLGAWDAMFFGDPRWLEQFGKDLTNFAGLKITIRDNYLNKPGIKVIRYKSDFGLSHIPSYIHWNNNSGAAAINLAVHFGAGRIILLGFDMKTVEGKNNYHDIYGNKPSANYDTRFLPRFPAIANDLKKLGIECLNANPDSALECFPKVRWEEVC